MAGSITPLPVMLEEEDRKIYERLQPPKSIVVRYGYQKLVAELPYDGDAKPGCGSKLVVRTPRGIELGEMLTTTCPNSGCSKSVSRKEMLAYIDNSGGKDYPFVTQGKVVRVATVEDLNEQARLDAQKPAMIKFTKAAVAELNLSMRLVEVEPLLGGERIIFYYTSENWVDFRELVRILSGEYQTRIEMHQVNAREEARVSADYERCGQYCCCKNFLKVLKPVSMRSAKVQKATLDPTKISGRCGRLMCCLRYEDETYEDLRKRLPHRKTVVETEDGIGEVMDTQILTQLVLVRIPGQPGSQAYPLENLRILDKEETKAWHAEQRRLEKERADREAERLARRGGWSRGAKSPQAQPQPQPPADPAGASTAEAKEAPRSRRPRRERGEPRRPQPGQPLNADEVESKEGDGGVDLPVEQPDVSNEPVSRGYGNQVADSDAAPRRDDAEAASDEPTGDEGGKKRRRRRRRRRGRGKGGGDTPSSGGGGPTDPTSE